MFYAILCISSHRTEKHQNIFLQKLQKISYLKDRDKIKHKVCLEQNLSSILNLGSHDMLLIINYKNTSQCK